MQSALIALFAGSLLATSALGDSVKVENAWVRATAPGQKVAGGFMDLTADAEMTLVGGSSPLAASLELHFMRMENGVMEMRELQEITLTKERTVRLQPGGLHLMFIGLKTQIKPGQQVPLTLTVKGSDGQEQTLNIQASARRGR